MSTAEIPKELVDLVEGGSAIMVGTRDDDLQPACARGTGAKVAAERRAVTVYLPSTASARVLANLARHPAVAVGFASPIDHVAIQLKGTCVDVRVAADEERGVTERYVAVYGQLLTMLGIPRALSARIVGWPAHAVTFAVEDIFVQTPGPGAGTRMGRR